MIGKIKNLLLNKNTVTILGVLAGVIALWFFYSMTLDKAVKPQKIPVATKELTAGTIITKDDIEYIEINNDALKKASVITESSQLIGYYVTNDTSVVKGAMFYKEQIVSKDELTTRDIVTAPEGYRIYPLKVNKETTYSNSIYPGDKIDLWLKAKVDGKHVYEEFIKNIEVLSVKDSDLKNVFDVSSGRTPQYLWFAVNDEMYEYLKKIENLSGMELYPVPINKNTLDKEADVEITNQELVTLIESKSIDYDNNSVEVNENNEE